MLETINKLAEEARMALREAKTIEELGGLRIKYLGRKAELSNILRNLKDLPEEERKSVGKAVNDLKVELENLFSGKQADLSVSKPVAGSLDVTLPGFRPQRGRLHPITQVLNEAKDIFKRL